MVSGVDENRNIHILDIIRERMDAREIVDTLIHLQRHHNPEIVAIEEMQVSKSIGPFLREEMIRTGVFLNLLPLKHGGKDKIARTRSIQARMRMHNVYFDKDMDWYSVFEEECVRFPRDRHDDQVDCFAYLGIMLDNIIEAPTQQEQEDEDYDERYAKSSSGDGGRSQYTGY
jgi:predicted phage terminase large subunit-like protein